FIIGSKSSVIIGETMAFAVLAFAQIIHGFNIRSNKESIFKMGFFSNKYYIGAATISILLQLIVLNIPVMMKLFKVVYLTNAQLLIVGALSIMPILIVEIVKGLGLNTAKDER